MVVSLWAGWAMDLPFADLGDSSRAAIERLRKDSGYTLEMSWNSDAGTPALLAGTLTRPSKHTPPWIAYGFLTQNGPLYGLKRASEDVKIVSTEQDASGTVRLRLQRMLFGRPVCGDELTMVITTNGVVSAVKGTFHAGLEAKRLNRPMVPAVDVAKAAEIATRMMAEHGVAGGQAEVQACYKPDREGVPLVYSVTVKDAAEAPHRVIIHSMTGRIIE